MWYVCEIWTCSHSHYFTLHVGTESAGVGFLVKKNPSAPRPEMNPHWLVNFQVWVLCVDVFGWSNSTFITVKSSFLLVNFWFSDWFHRHFWMIKPSLDTCCFSPNARWFSHLHRTLAYARPPWSCDGRRTWVAIWCLGGTSGAGAGLNLNPIPNTFFGGFLK